MEYSKDYFLGMKHLADALKYEFYRRKDYWTDKAMASGNYEKYKTCLDINSGINEALHILDETLGMQLEVKAGEQNE